MFNDNDDGTSVEEMNILIRLENENKDACKNLSRFVVFNKEMYWHHIKELIYTSDNFNRYLMMLAILNVLYNTDLDDDKIDNIMDNLAKEVENLESNLINQSKLNDILTSNGIDLPSENKERNIE